MGNDTNQHDLCPDPEQLLADVYELFDEILTLCGTGKLTINHSIARRVQELDEKFGLSKNDLLHIIFTDYLRTKSYQRFDPAKGKLVTFLLKITSNQLNQIRRKCKAVLKGCNMMISLDEFYAGFPIAENARLGSSLSFWERQGASSVATRTTPEDILMEKELWDLFEGHFGKFDAEVIMEGKDREAAAEELGMEYFSYCKRLQRFKASFVPVLAGAGYIN
jgi:hypothetical protein